MHRRHATVENRTTLAWDDSYGRHRADARLVGLSHSEALLLAEAIPPTRQLVWLRLEQPATTNWVAAIVFRRTRGLKHRLIGTHRIRLRFLATCPYEFFELAMHGPAPDEDGRRVGTSESEAGIRR